MIIVESILTTYEVSFIFWASWGNSKYWLELKIETILENFNLPKSVKHTVVLDLFATDLHVLSLKLTLKLFSSLLFRKKTKRMGGCECDDKSPLIIIR